MEPMSKALNPEKTCTMWIFGRVPNRFVLGLRLITGAYKQVILNPIYASLNPMS